MQTSQDLAKICTTVHPWAPLVSEVAVVLSLETRKVAKGGVKEDLKDHDTCDTVHPWTLLESKVPVLLCLETRKHFQKKKEKDWKTNGANGGLEAREPNPQTSSIASSNARKEDQLQYLSKVKQE